MCKSTLMKQAHAMCRDTLQAGDNYHVTLGLCIKALHAKPAAPSKFELFKSALRIDFGGLLVSASIAFMIMLWLALVVGTVQTNDTRMDRLEYRQSMRAIDYSIQQANDFEFNSILAEAAALQAAYLATYK